MAKLIYVADPMCSWCWGFAPVIKQLGEEGHEVTLVMGGLRAGETRRITPELRQYVLHHWQQVAETTGQPFNFENALPEGFVYDTEPACRAVVTLRYMAAEKALSFLHGLQEAFYADGRDIKDAELLALLAEQQGLDGQLFLEQWSSDAMRTATAADFERKEQLGVMGFPSMLIDTGERLRMLSMGYQDYESITRQIERRLAKPATASSN